MNYPSMFAAWLNDQAVDTRRVLWQAWYGETVVARHQLAWVLPRKLRLRLCQPFTKQLTSSDNTPPLLLPLPLLLLPPHRHSSSSSCVFFISRRLTSQGVPNCPVLCSSFQFTVISQILSNPWDHQYKLFVVFLLLWHQWLKKLCDWIKVPELYESP